MPKFIVYACPVGELAAQLEAYWAKSRWACGPNQAQQYMPHCTLTGFFEDVTISVPHYTQTLARSLQRYRRSQPHPPLAIIGLRFEADWHGLELSSDWLKALILDFVCTAPSPTRQSPLRPKEWLHLSLAYGFRPDQAATLQTLAQAVVDPHAATGWQLRFYQQNPDSSWLCHQRLQLI